jgi:hypothetical protein
MLKDVVDIVVINSVVVKFEMMEQARFLEFTLMKNTCWTKQTL